MTDQNSTTPIETPMTDRQILQHLLMHAEAQTVRLQQMQETIVKLDRELESFRPLLETLRQTGNIGMVQMGIAVRRARRQGT